MVGIFAAADGLPPVSSYSRELMGAGIVEKDDVEGSRVGVGMTPRAVFEK